MEPTALPPLSRIAGAALRVSLISAALALVAGFGHRLGWWDFGIGFILLAIAVLGALAGIVLSAWGALAARPSAPRRGLGRAVLGLLVSAAVIAPPIHWMLLARSVPPIHDITTDTGDPPRFVAIAPLRSHAPDPGAYGGPRVAALQRAAYPDIRPVLLDIPPRAAFDRALAAARAMGWHIVASVPADGRIEATATTFWFGFKDDVVVRVRPRDGGSRVDIRSMSRVGKSDLGTNARRVRAFMRRLQAGTPRKS